MFGIRGGTLRPYGHGAFQVGIITLPVEEAELQGGRNNLLDESRSGRRFAAAR
jgi:hypothetical protein